jgi:hypothetical protein
LQRRGSYSAEDMIIILKVLMAVAAGFVMLALL